MSRYSSVLSTEISVRELIKIISSWECQCFVGKPSYKLQITNYTMHVHRKKCQKIFCKFLLKSNLKLHRVIFIAIVAIIFV